MADLASLRHLIIDMDGVLWQGDTALPGLVEFFSTLRRLEITFVLATNNASRTPDQYVAKLGRLGVVVSRNEILTSAQAAAQYVAQGSGNGARVFAIGEDGVRDALTEQGCSLCNLYETDAQYVVVGMDRGLSWDKLASATLNIRAGAKFIGTNPDVTFPTERGVTHGNGAILAALQTATDVAPTIIGKPEPGMYQIAMGRLGGTGANTAAVGDRLETDILGAKRAGLPSILVLSGVTTQEQLEASEYQPEWVFDDIRALSRALDSQPAPSHSSREAAIRNS